MTDDEYTCLKGPFHLQEGVRSHRDEPNMSTDVPDNEGKLSL